MSQNQSNQNLNNDNNANHYAVGVGHRWVLVSRDVVAMRQPNSDTVTDPNGAPLFKGTVQEFCRSFGGNLVPAPDRRPTNVQEALGISKPQPKAWTPDPRHERRKRLEEVVSTLSGTLVVKGDKAIITLPDSKGKLGVLQLSLDGELLPYVEKGSNIGLGQMGRAKWLIDNHGAALRAVVTK